MNKLWILVALCTLMLLGMLAGCGNLNEDPAVDTGNPFATSSTASKETEETIDSKWEEILTYREYLDMTPEERNDFYASFEDSNEFYTWFDAVKAIYEANRAENQIGNGGSIDMGDLDNAG